MTHPKNSSIHPSDSNTSSNDSNAPSSTSDNSVSEGGINEQMQFNYLDEDLNNLILPPEGCCFHCGEPVPEAYSMPMPKIWPQISLPATHQ